jgi:hypothetical protein
MNPFALLFIRLVQRVAARTGYPTWAILLAVAFVICGGIAAISVAQNNL